MNLTKFLPNIAKQYLPSLNREICKKLDSVQVKSPDYAAFVLTSVDDEARLSLCIFDDTNRCNQVVWTEPAVKLIDVLLKKID